MKKPRVWEMICIIFVFCGVTAIASPAQIFTTLYSFDFTDGYQPRASLVQGTDGNLYGTALFGGGNGSCLHNCGTVFKITPSGTLTTLHSFGGIDGAYPYAGLVQATDGNLYGTTSFEGGGSYGTVFKITPSGALTTLHTFSGADGTDPYATLIQATDGNLYGTTSCDNSCAPFNRGTVFKIAPEYPYTLTTLHSFDGFDGALPYAGLVQAADGNFYGTTNEGGASGVGTVFKITPTGTLSTLHSFSFNRTDGSYPSAGLVQATDGNLYGTTYSGGTNGRGAIFRITFAGALAILHSFDGAEGSNPYAGLIQASDGNFYGTTQYGGANGAGTVFKITPSGTLTTLHSFDGSDGANPDGGLIQAADGNFYGTAVGGGAYGYGTVFRLALLRACIVCPSAE